MSLRDSVRGSVRERPFLRQVRHVHPDPRDPRTAAVRRQILRDFGALVAPYALHLPAPDLLAAYWAINREPTSGSRVARAQKEAVAAAVSTANRCPFCVDVHATMLRALGDRAPAAAIAAENPDAITDPELRALVTWARASGTLDAVPRPRRPFPDQHAPELIGTAVAFHYINRMVNIFAAESPFPFASATTRPLLRAVAVPAFRRFLTRRMRPGAAVELLPPSPLPGDLSWAGEDPTIAEAFARAAGSFDTAGRRFVPEPVRQLVSDRLAAWRGEDPGLSRAWVEEAVEPLPAQQRPLGRLAMLAAFASYQVDAAVIDQARPHPGPSGDEVLIATAGWASFAAARRIGSWLAAAVPAAGVAI